TLANSIRQEQAQGTLEGVLMTPVSVQTFILASSVYDFVQVTFTSSLYFIFGWLFFGVRFQGNYLLALLFLILMTLVLAAISILLIFLGVLMPFSLWVFKRAVRRAKREGSLIQY